MNTRTKIAASGLVIAALAATATPAFAASHSASAKGKGASHSALVRSNARLHVGPLAALVSAGTITQALADTVETTTRTAMETAEVGNFNAGLAALVANNTITQALADAATASVSTTAKRGPRDHMNLSTWTTAQRIAFHTWLAAHPIDRTATSKAAVATLVTAGTLTQIQADAIDAAFAAAPARGMDVDGDHHGRRHHNGQFSMSATAGVTTTGSTTA